LFKEEKQVRRARQ